MKKSIWPRSDIHFFLRAQVGVLSGHRNPHEPALFRVTLHGVPTEVDGKAKRIRVKFPGKELAFVVRTVYELQGWTEVLEACERWDIRQFYTVGRSGYVGGGGLYEEYQGLRKRDEMEVTIRVSRLDVMSKKEVERVNRDLFMLEEKRHRGMIQVVDALEMEYTLYTVFPRVRGTAQMLVKSGVDERGARRVAHQLLEALAQLHELGYAHTAINAENVVFLQREALRVRNYHDAVSVDASGYLPLNHRYGKGKYLAPECIVRAPCTTKVDVWAVGVLSYEILAGKTPWTTGNVQEMYEKPPDSLRFFDGVECGEQCRDLIRKMLILDQLERLSAAEALKHKWFDIYNEDSVKEWHAF